MVSNNLLRKQVVSEVKKRRLIFFTVILLGFIYLAISLIFGDMGLLRYVELNKKKAHLERQVKEMEKENEQLRSEIKSLKEDPFYKEKHAREEFGLARPDEYIFRYDDR
ncbi:MAG: septum formation initiator family protein [Thermodesulfovibrionales bacterium]|nr:septum formation initiator family protein [Thermodesulfovibrionales bacterium]